MSSARVPTGQREAKRQSAAERRTVTPYAHEEAMDRLLGRDTPAIARVLGLARRTIQQWRDRYDSDHRGPGRTLAIAIRGALDVGRPVDDALAPVAALADEFEHDLVARSEARGERISLLDALAEVSVDFGDLVQTATTALADRRLSAPELATIKGRCRELRESVDALEREAEASAGGAQRPRRVEIRGEAG